MHLEKQLIQSVLPRPIRLMRVYPLSAYPSRPSSYTHRKGLISASFLSQCERPYLTFNADSPGTGYHCSYSSSTSFVSLKL